MQVLQRKIMWPKIGRTVKKTTFEGSEEKKTRRTEKNKGKSEKTEGRKS